MNLSLSLIDEASYNPPSRTKRSGLMPLSRSMSKHGQLIPIMVIAKGDRYQLVDGHRRFAVAKNNDWPTIKAMIVDDNEDDLYASFNFTARKLGGNECLYVWLRNPRAVSQRLQELLSDMQETIGRKRMQRICDAKLSHRIYTLSIITADYCDLKDDQISVVVDYFLDHGLQFMIHSAMREDYDPAAIKRAILNNRRFVRKDVLSMEDVG